MRITVVDSRGGVKDYDSTYPQINLERILEKLNSVIDWNNSNFPVKLKPEIQEKLYGSANIKDKVELSESIYEMANPANWIQNREYLGEIPELKPGNVFEWDGTAFLVNSPNNIVGIVSESGVYSINRLEETIEKEYELQMMNYPLDLEVLIEPCNSFSSLPESFKKTDSNLTYSMILVDKLGEDFKKNGDIKFFKISLKSEEGDYQVELFSNRSSIFYDENDLDEVTANAFAKVFLSKCISFL